jgi:hypothetical protein
MWAGSQEDDTKRVPAAKNVDKQFFVQPSPCGGCRDIIRKGKRNSYARGAPQVWIKERDHTRHLTKAVKSPTIGAQS